MGLASAAEQLKMTFAPLQTVSSLTCNWTPSGESAKNKTLSVQLSSHQISPDISISDLMIETAVSKIQNRALRVEELEQRKIKISQRKNNSCKFVN